MFLLCLLGPQKSASFPSGLARRLQGPGAPGASGGRAGAGGGGISGRRANGRPAADRFCGGFCRWGAGGDALEIDPAAMIQ